MIITGTWPPLPMLIRSAGKGAGSVSVTNHTILLLGSQQFFLPFPPHANMADHLSLALLPELSQQGG